MVGDFNATGPEAPLSMGGLLETCRTVVRLRRRARLDDATSSCSSTAPARGWSCRSGSSREDAPLLQVDVSRALAAGLRFRPLEETVADTLAWARRRTRATGELASGLVIGEAGMAPEKEAELLAAWRAH